MIPTFPLPPSSPLSPDPLTPAQERLRRARQMAAIRAGQMAGQLPTPAPPPRATGVAPATRRFALSEVKRLPVAQSAAARAFLVSSSSEGRVFPQALSEAFALVDGVASIELDYAPQQVYFAGAPADAFVVMVTLIPTRHAHLNTRRAFLAASDLTAISSSAKGRHVVFRAAVMAHELARLYPDQLTHVTIIPEATPVVLPD